MHRLIFLLLLTVSIQSNAGDWVTDSLAHYQKKVSDALNDRQYESFLNLQRHIYEQGRKSLKPEVYAFLYTLVEDDRLSDYPEGTGSVWHNLGNLEFYRGRIGTAKHNFSMAFEEYKKAGRKGDAAGMAMNLGIIREREGKYDSAITSYLQAMPIFREVKDTAAVAVCLENTGLAYRYKGESQTALRYLQQTDSVLRLITPETNIRWTNLYYNYCDTYMQLSDYDQALSYGLKGLRLSELNEDERQVNMGYIKLEKLYFRIGDDVNWRKYMRKALVYARETENELRIADIHYSMASHFLDNGNMDSARYYAGLGMDYFQENDLVEGRGRGELIFGRIAFEKGQYREAILRYESALDQFNPSGMEIAGAYQSLGTSYMRTGDYTRAEEYLEMALGQRISIGDLAAISATYRALSENSELSGDFRTAYEYHRLFKHYADSVFNDKRIQQLAELETQYETEKKDQAITALEQDREIQSLRAQRRESQIYIALAGLTIVLLLAGFYFNRSRIRQRANHELKQLNEEIKEQDKEKETLLKEIHHRVKNNLQVISSLLNMQTRKLQDENAIDAMKESQSRVKTMALIHEKLYQYDNLSRIDMKEYMEQLSDFLAQTYNDSKQIDVIIESENVNLDIDTAVPLGLIANELLSNAWKYAFEGIDKGEIRISLQQYGENKYQFKVSDSGKGMTEIPEKPQTLGLRLVRSLTRQIQGQLHVQSDKGVTFRIDFEELPVAV